MKFQKFSCCSHKLLMYLTFTWWGTVGAFPWSPWRDVTGETRTRSPWTEVDTINKSTKFMKFTSNIKKMKYCSNIRKTITKFQKFSCCSHKLLLYLTFTWWCIVSAFPWSHWTDVEGENLDTITLERIWHNKSINKSYEIHL